MTDDNHACEPDFEAMARDVWAHSMTLNRTALFDAFAAQSIKTLTVELNRTELGESEDVRIAIGATDDQPEGVVADVIDVMFVWHVPTLLATRDDRLVPATDGWRSCDLTLTEALLTLCNDLLGAYDKKATAHYCKLVFDTINRKIELEYEQGKIELNEHTRPWDGASAMVSVDVLGER